MRRSVENMKFSGTEFSHPGDDSAIEELQGSL
jgi:hypothetical protein